MASTSDTPYVLLIGMDLPADTSDEDLVAWRDGYSVIHVPEAVESHPGFVRGTRYELIEPDARGDLGPRWLVLFEMSSQAAAEAFMARVDGDPSAYPLWRRWTNLPWSMRWRVVWKRHDGYSGAIGKWGRPYLLIEGMDAAEGTDAAGLVAFDKFYNEVRVPDVVAKLGFDQALRFERVRSFDHPSPGCPRFMAAYDGSEEVLRVRAQPGGLPPIADDGPPAWTGRDTKWQLLYRRVSSYARLATIEP